MAARLRTRSPGPGIREYALGTTTLVGRHRSCGVPLDAPAVPAFWLELRWTASGWMWRELGPSEVARGAGAAMGYGWRALRVGGRIRVDEDTWLELVDDAAPEVVLVDVVTGEERRGAALDDLVEISDGRVLPLHADGEPSAELRDGDAFHDGRRTWRVLRPDVLDGTFQGGVTVGHPTCTIDLDLTARSVTVTVGTASCTAHGGPVLAMAPYAIARRDGAHDDGGWLTLTEAHAWWVRLGGAAASPPERLNWERAKLRTALAREGARGLDALFTVRRRVGETVIRVALPPDRIEVREG